MNFVISTLTNKNPDKPQNEDLVGSYGDVFWLLDGASSANQSTLTTKMYVNYLNQKLVETLQTSSMDIPLQNLVRESIKKTTELIKDPLTLQSIPSSTIIVVRINPHNIEYFVLGDSSLVIEINSRVEHISDNRLQRVGLDIRNNIISLLKQGYEYNAPEVKKQKKELVQLQQTYRNMESGFYIASNDPSVANYALTGTRKLDRTKNWNISLMSDGLSRLVDTFQTIPSWKNLNTYLKNTDAMSIIHDIRSIEHFDPNGHKYPRFRKHDDISLLMIQNKENLQIR